MQASGLVQVKLEQSLLVATLLVSHVSVPSSTPLPHRGAQSASLVALQVSRPPPGQQLSLVVAPLQVVIGVVEQETLHAAFVPLRTAVEQAGGVGQVMAAHEVAGSQVSAPSTTPLPHTALQSVSFVALHPIGQHMSPGVARLHVVIGVCVQVTWHASAPTTFASTVHGLLSLQL